MDEQTMKDYIEDLLQERKDLYGKITKQSMELGVFECEVISMKAEMRSLQAEVKRLEMELARHV